MQVHAHDPPNHTTRILPHNSAMEKSEQTSKKMDLSLFFYIAPLWLENASGPPRKRHAHERRGVTAGFRSLTVWLHKENSRSFAGTQARRTVVDTGTTHEFPA